MNLEIMTKLEQYFNENPNLKGTPVKEADIISAQNNLGIKFNSDYIYFLKKYGGASAGMDIYSVSSTSNSSIIGNENVIEQTIYLWNEYSHHDNFLRNLYVISDDGSGNPILMHSNGEIFIFYHDDFTIQKLYSNLEELFQQSL